MLVSITPACAIEDSCTGVNARDILTDPSAVYSGGDFCDNQECFTAVVDVQSAYVFDPSGSSSSDTAGMLSAVCTLSESCSFLDVASLVTNGSSAWIGDIIDICVADGCVPALVSFMGSLAGAEVASSINETFTDFCGIVDSCPGLDPTVLSNVSVLASVLGTVCEEECLAAFRTRAC